MLADTQDFYVSRNNFKKDDEDSRNVKLIKYTLIKLPKK